MATAVDRFLADVRGLGLEPDIHEFAQGTRTAAEAAAAVGTDVAAIVKSLVFIADDEPVLVLTSGANRVDTAKVGAAVGASHVRKANADEVRDATGCAIGGTHPFVSMATLRRLVDVDLLDQEQVWAAAGTATTMWPLSPSTLTDIAGAAPTDIAEASPSGSY